MNAILLVAVLRLWLRNILHPGELLRWAALEAAVPRSRPARDGDRVVSIRDAAQRFRRLYVDVQRRGRRHQPMPSRLHYFFLAMSV